MDETHSWLTEWMLWMTGAARGKSVATKLEVIRAAAKHEFPTGDIDIMLAEIDNGSARS
jgi:hypothetical protein